MPECSHATRVVATLAMIYVAACVVYVALTRHVGTPFKDSLTEEQRALKRESAAVRKTCFLLGVAIGSMVVLCARPFA